MNEVKIQIPDNCELIKDGDTYIVREKKQGPPRSWEEFCEKYPTKNGEAYISTNGEVVLLCVDNSSRAGTNWCTSKEEAEAFLALMQLRQLRKVWVEDWKPTSDGYYAITYCSDDRLSIAYYTATNKVMSFPSKEMTEYFLNCFGDLCETAKMLL